MSSTHEIDFLLGEYAVGALPVPAEVLVRSHLELQSGNRGWVADLHALGGTLLDSAYDGADVNNHVELGLLLDRLGGPETEYNIDVAGVADGDRSRGLLPLALRKYVGRDESALDWRFRIPGLRECVIGSDDGCSASLLKITPGRAMPAHTHGGREITLVLQGGFSDHTGHYVRGDIAVAGEDVDHKPVADAGEACICFAVSESDLRLTGPIGRLISGFTRR